MRLAFVPLALLAAPAATPAGSPIDPGRMLAVAPGLCADLLAHGRAPLQVAAAAMAASGRMRCVDLEAEDPLGQARRAHNAANSSIG